MKVVVGLGNPGARYDQTRHNVGFMVLEELARRLGAGRTRRRFDGELAEVRLGDEAIVLVAPQTWMNASGRCVRQVVRFYQLDAGADLLVICDDLALPLGKLRLRRRGSAGGHNGLKDIVAQLGTEEYARLRIGIGQPPPERESVDWVLGRFSRQERAEVEEAVVTAAEATCLWVESGSEAVMNRYN